MVIAMDVKNTLRGDTCNSSANNAENVVNPPYPNATSAIVTDSAMTGHSTRFRVLEGVLDGVLDGVLTRCSVLGASRSSGKRQAMNAISRLSAVISRQSASHPYE